MGDVPRGVLHQYSRLVTKHRQVELQLLRSFYKEQQKSPFKFLPWKSGVVHFRFLTVRWESQHTRLAVTCSSLQILVWTTGGGSSAEEPPHCAAHVPQGAGRHRHLPRPGVC